MKNICNKNTQKIVPASIIYYIYIPDIVKPSISMR